MPVCLVSFNGYFSEMKAALASCDSDCAHSRQVLYHELHPQPPTVYFKSLDDSQ